MAPAISSCAALPLTARHLAMESEQSRTESYQIRGGMFTGPIPRALGARLKEKQTVATDTMSRIHSLKALCKLSCGNRGAVDAG